jgi:hypothetical protein
MKIHINTTENKLVPKKKAEKFLKIPIFFILKGGSLRIVIVSRKQ